MSESTDGVRIWKEVDYISWVICEVNRYIRDDNMLQAGRYLKELEYSIEGLKDMLGHHVDECTLTERMIPTEEEFEANYQMMREYKGRLQSEGSDYTLSLRDGFDMPLPPRRQDMLDRYAALRFMGYTPEDLAKGMYSVSHGPDDKGDGE